MKRFVRRKEDVPYIHPPKAWEVLKAAEDAWASTPDTTVRIDKHGNIQVITNSPKGTRFFSYRFEPRLSFSDGCFLWFVETFDAGDKSRIQIGNKEPYPLVVCNIPYMGVFTGHAADIAELEAAVKEFEQAKCRVETLLASEAPEAPKDP